MSGLWKQARKFMYHRILHADDTPHRIALGVAVATFVAFTPTIGVQMVLAVAIAAALRANKAVCIPFVWITNPLTAVPIYSSCWLLGAWLVNGKGGADTAAVVDRLAAVASVPIWSHLLEWSFWSSVFALLVDLGTELWLGCCIVGLAGGGILYVFTRWGVTAYRRRRAERKMRRDARRHRPLLEHPQARAVLRRRESA